MSRGERRLIWETVRGSYYDPRTRKIHLDRNAPPYVAVHEWAHARQHRFLTIAYRFWEVTSILPWVRRLSRLWVEWEADAIARAEMRRCGIWDESSREISRMVIWNYARWILVP
jgi:hypothetical protein